MNKITLTRPPRNQLVYVRSEASVKTKKTAGVVNPPLPPSIEGVYKGGIPRAADKKEKEGSDLASILELADKLNPTEKKTLLARLALNAQDQGKQADRDQEMWAQAVYDELGRALGYGAGAGLAPAMVKRSLSVPTVWAPVMAFMSSSKLLDLNVTERQSVYGLLAKLITKHASYVANKSGAPLSAKLVGSCSANLASVFDNAFPGYLAAGLAPMVARQLVRQK